MFSKTCKYAIRAVLHLAAHSSKDQKIGTKKLAENLEVPYHFLGKILQELSRHQLISSSKGPSGGFYLSPENRQTSLIEIIEAIDGPDVFSSCVIGLKECSSDHPCPLHDKVITYREGLLSLIEDQTLEYIVQDSTLKDIDM